MGKLTDDHGISSDDFEFPEPVGEYPGVAMERERDVMVERDIMPIPVTSKVDDTQLRAAALQGALALGNHDDVNSLLDAAKALESYLRGDATETTR